MTAETGVARSIALLALGTAMLPLWIAGIVARLVFEGAVIGWWIGEKILEWVRA